MEILHAEQTVQLGEIADVFSGFAFKSSDLGYSGIPVIKIANIREKQVSKECKDAFPHHLVTQQLEKYILQERDCLVAMTGAGSVGKMGKMKGIGTGRYLVNQRVGIIRPQTDRCDANYVSYALSLEHYERILYGLGLGAGQPNVSAKQISQLELPFPSLPTQKKIASVLSAYDDLIENNERRIKILEEMAQSIYREWFVNYRFPGHENVRMVDSELGEIPEGWSSINLGSLVRDVRVGINPQEADPDTPYVGLEHIPRQRMTLSEYGDIHSVSSNKLRFQEGDILFGKIRPYFHKIVIAPFAGICSSDTIVLRVNEPNMLPISLSTVFSEEFVAHSSATSQGTKMPRANWDVLSKYPVPVAPSPILHSFNDFMTNAIQECSSLARKNQNLRETRDLVLPKLISGELDVEELDIAVP